jgi:hypothetical protein
MMPSKKYIMDLVERAGWTFAQAFIAAWMVAGATNWSVIENALFAAIPAALSVVKSGLARYAGDKETASFIK